MYLEQDVNGRCYLKNTGLVLLVIVDFRNGIVSTSSKRYDKTIENL
ncbi:MAG TPA: hypothetical protein VIY08_14255 [Candidatus Nitrosocosmicus sp.]